MDLSFRFDRWLDALPTSPRDEGVVHRLVVRPTNGERATPETISVTAEDGIAGDRWATSEHRAPGNQVSLINVHILRGVADGDEARMPLSGDNLQVDLDLSQENLPVGTRLEIGSAVLEISPMPHRPCTTFRSHFDANGAKKVARADRLGRRGRGVLCQVVTDGEIRRGDRIRVLRPAQ